jgi:hypothetical protein
MPECVQQFPLATLLFVVVFALNVAPAFAPPTSVTLSFIGFSMPDAPVAALALIVVSQLLLVPAIYAFTHVDWHAAFEGRLRWLRTT